MPLVHLMLALTSQTDRAELLSRQHMEWIEFHFRWQWEQDTLEGGNRYRTAWYGLDDRGLPEHNLVRYKRDYPDYSSQRTQGAYGENLPGADPQADAESSDFAMRLARTPPPHFLEEAIGIHLSKIYKTQVQRSGPPALEEWWKDVDGKGTSIDEWMRDTIAPLFLSNAQVDLCMDHPPKPDGEIVNTRADELRLGLTKCVASYILPQNIVWWKLDAQGRYVECLVLEPQDEGNDLYRHWMPDGWVLYEKPSDKELKLGAEITVKDFGDHPFGRPPIERTFDRKRHRCRHVGVNLYESICERTRAYYNLNSELVLSDSVQAHPTLQAPQDLLATGAIEVGPSNVLPMMKCQGSDGQVVYEGWSYVDPPKGAADSIRLHMQNERDEIDRLACLAKPAGADSGSTVSQSGYSKAMDQSTGNDLLSKIAGALARVERSAACLALLVLGDGKVDPADVAAIQISYPKTFELADDDGLTRGIEGFQACLATSGSAPKTETELMKRKIRLLLPGRDDDIYAELDEEVEEFIEAKAATFEQDQEAAKADQQAMTQPKPSGTSADAAQTDLYADDEEPETDV
ncbi:MAG: hypothetical protein KGL39_24840 [Patescibacteria group bacterium]|nr:hypothetical protein [Patescibacteria group bacterium]